MSFWRLNRWRIAYFAGLIVAIVVGALIDGGTGTAVTAIAGGLLAATIILLAGGGLIFMGRGSRERRYARPPAEDEGFRD